jgi:hypothetical protein
MAGGFYGLLDVLGDDLSVKQSDNALGIFRISL